MEYTAAMLLDEEYKTKTPLSKRLHEISCPGNVINPTYNHFHLFFCPALVGFFEYLITNR